MNRKFAFFLLLLLSMAMAMIPSSVFAADGDDGQSSQFQAVMTPENPKVELGGSVTLDVTITGGNPDTKYTYLWQEEDRSGERSIIEGATSASLLVANVTCWKMMICEIWDSDGNHAWLSCEVSVENGLHMDTSTEYLSKPYGGAVEMSVEATANQGGITYQWSAFDREAGDWIDIEGADQTAYTVANATAKKSYRCRVTDIYGNRLEKVFFVSLDTGLEASTSKDRYTVAPGESVTLSVTASNKQNIPIHYCWTRQTYDTVAMDSAIETIDGETGPSLTIKNVSASEYYYCEVTDDAGGQATVFFRVSVDSGLEVESRGSGNVPYGESVELTVNASVKEGNIRYSWMEADENGGIIASIDGVDGPSYVVPAVKSNKIYRCRIYDDYGNSTDAFFYLYVDYGLEITKQPQDTSVSKGGNTTLSIRASINEAAQLQYQWYEYKRSEGQIKLEGETGRTLEVKDVRSRRVFFCVVSDGREGNGKSLTSEPAAVTVDTGLDVRTNGFAVTVKHGETKKLIVEAESKEKKITYKWTTGDNLEKTHSIKPTNSSKPWEMKIKGEKKNYDICNYYCEVSDGFNTEKVSFRVIWDYGMKADYKKEISVAPGESCKLKVKLSSNLKGQKFKYQWYMISEKDEDGIRKLSSDEASGMKTDTLTLKKCNKTASYICYISNEYHDGMDVIIKVNVGKGFSISNDEEVAIKSGETGLLKVDVQADDMDGMTYVWRKEAYPRGPWQWKEIKDSTTNTLQCTEPGRYSCIVADKYNNQKTAYFNVKVDSGLEVDNSVTVHAKAGQRVPLHVDARTNSDKELTYQWHLDDMEQDEKTDTLTLIAKKYQEIKCRVSDGYNYEWVYFNISLDGDFQAEADGKSTFNVAYGDDVTCKVKITGAEGSDLEYDWIGVDGTAIGSATNRDTCKMVAKKTGTIICRVNDGKGFKEIPFDINIDTGLKLTYDETVSVYPGVPVTLEVNACGSNSGKALNYHWYQLDEQSGERLEDIYMPYEDEFHSTLKIESAQNGIFECVVDDGVTTKTARMKLLVDPDKERLTEEYKAEVEAASAMTAGVTGISNQKGGKALITWESSAGNSGFQVRCCMSKAFKKDVKTLKVANPDAKETVVKKLETGKTWYFQVRTYTDVMNGVTGRTSPVYGQWSETRQVMIKK